MKSIDLTKEKVITLGDLTSAAQADTTELLLSESALVTPSALEFVEQHRISLRRGARAPAAAQTVTVTDVGPIHDLFTSPEAEAVKEEICHVGRKLWQRAYVDGNGGNISYRRRPSAHQRNPHAPGDLPGSSRC